MYEFTCELIYVIDQFHSQALQERSMWMMERSMWMMTPLRGKLEILSPERLLALV
jgi:hypothetical protein